MWFPLWTTPTLICLLDRKTSRSPIFTQAQGCVQFSALKPPNSEQLSVMTKTGNLSTFFIWKLTSFTLVFQTNSLKMSVISFSFLICSKNTSVRNSRSSCTGFKICTCRQAEKERKTMWYRCLQTPMVSFPRLFALVDWQSIKWGVTDTEGDTQIYTRVYTNTRYFRMVNSRKWQNVFKTTCTRFNWVSAWTV